MGTKGIGCDRMYLEEFGREEFVKKEVGGNGKGLNGKWHGKGYEGREGKYL